MKTATPVKVTPAPKKDVNQWYDVGIIKTTHTVVSYYYLPSESGLKTEDVSIMETLRQKMGLATKTTEYFLHHLCGGVCRIWVLFVAQNTMSTDLH